MTSRGLPAVLDDLESLLGRSVPEVAQARRAPVSVEDLEALRAAVAPLPLPADLVLLLQWSDGFDAALWPGVGQACAGARDIADGLRQLREIADYDESPGWPAGWLPVETFSDLQFVIDITRGAPCAVLMTAWAHSVTVKAPSLAAALDLNRRLEQVGVPLGDPDDLDDGRDAAEWNDAVRRLAYASDVWVDWPFDLSIDGGPSAWPPEWRTSIGLPPTPDVERREPRPINSLVLKEDGRATIEGYAMSLGRLATRADYPENSWTHPVPRVIEFRDASGVLNVLLQAPRKQQHWVAADPATPPDRLQLDVTFGPSARATAQDIVERWNWHPSAPLPVDAVATSCRPALQTLGADPALRLPGERQRPDR